MAAKPFKLALVIQGIDKATAPLKKINAQIERFQAPLRRLNNSFQAIGDAAGFGRLGSAVGKAHSRMQGVSKAVKGLATKFAIVGGVAAAAFGKIVSDAVEASSKLVDLRNATGASVESIQTLGYAFEQSGGDTEGFQSGLVKFAKNLGDARKKAGPLFQALQKFDKPLLEKMLKTDDTGEALRLFINGIATARTDTERLSLATSAMGKTANKALASLAKDGAENLRMLEQQMPGLISEEEAVRAESFGDVLGRLSRQFGAMSLPIVNALIPALDSLARELTGFLQGKEGSIKTWAKDFGEKLPGRLKEIREGFETFWKKLQPIRDFLGWIADDSDRMAIALAALAVIVAGPVIASIVSLGSAFVGLGIAMMTTPIGWFAAALAGLIAIGALVVAHWEQVKSFFVSLWESPTVQVLSFINPVGQLIRAGKWLYDHWEPVVDLFSLIWEKLEPILRFGGKLFFGRAFDVPQFGPPAFGNASTVRTENKSKLKVEFENLPRGARVQADPGNESLLDLDLGYSMMGD